MTPQGKGTGASLSKGAPKERTRDPETRAEIVVRVMRDGTLRVDADGLPAGVIGALLRQVARRYEATLLERALGVAEGAEPERSASVTGPRA